MEYQPYSIRQLLDAVNSGSIRIPAFQRGFVWEMDKVAYLMDSIYKRYPFGSLLFWRTKAKLFKLKNGEISDLGMFPCDVSSTFFMSNQFSFRNANTKTFILILANNLPKSFLSGASVDLDRVLQKYNKTEFHHIYPRAYLRSQNISDSEIDCLANLCFLSASENKRIGKKKPSEYISLMPGGETLKNILSSSFCPEDTFNDDFYGFLEKRAAALVSFSQELIRSSS
ncbi:MAG: DUF262 domain-containing protein [Nodosilinea sp.]